MPHKRWSSKHGGATESSLDLLLKSNDSWIKSLPYRVSSHTYEFHWTKLRHLTLKVCSPKMDFSIFLPVNLRKFHGTKDEILGFILLLFSDELQQDIYEKVPLESLASQDTTIVVKLLVVCLQRVVDAYIL